MQWTVSHDVRKLLLLKQNRPKQIILMNILKNARKLAMTVSMYILLKIQLLCCILYFLFQIYLLK